jgi:hypothetical protein
VADPQPNYPETWTGPPGTGIIPGAYVTIESSDELGIYSGWETSIKFQKNATPPDVMTYNFEPFPDKIKGKDSQEMTLADLKPFPRFVIDGQYLRPFSNQDKQKKKRQADKVAKLAPATIGNHGMFNGPANPSGRNKGRPKGSKNKT